MNQKTYSYEEVYKESLTYFNGDSLAASKWISKYCLKNKEGKLLELTPKDMHLRIAKEISRIENNYPNPISEQELFELMDNFKYLIPQGSPMYGIGNHQSKTSISNCFVIGNNNEADSYGSIFRTDEEQVQLMKRRGGVGHDLSHLRPSGIIANGSKLGDSAGSTLYMNRFSESTREVAQDGRRGALMLSMDVRHPDIEKFIDKKLEEGKVTGANISVKITDEFMKAVVEDKDFYQCFPINLLDNKSSYIFFRKPELNKLFNINGGYVKIINARKLWNKIIHNAWKSAEPGVLFWDTIIKESPADCYSDLGFKTVSTNPCFTGDTIIAVADGRNGVSIKELANSGERFIVYSGRKNRSNGNNSKGWVVEIKEASAFKTGTKKVIKVLLSDGSSFKCTPEHLLAKDNNSYIEAKDSVGEFLSKFYSYSCKNSNKSYRHINSITNGNNRQYRMLWEYYNGSIDGKINNIDHIDKDSTNDFIGNLRLLSIEDHKKITLRNGLDNPINKIKDSKYFKLLNKRKNIQANGKKYNWSEERIESNLKEFDNVYGDAIKDCKPKDIDVLLNERVFVKEIIELGFEDVYDLNVEDNHNFYIITKTDDSNYLNSSGVLVHNCGELPLPPYDSCRLLAINLYSYVNEPFTQNATFDYELFVDHVNKAQRVMDDIVDLEIEKLNLIISKIESDKEPDDIKFVELNLWKKIKEKAIQGRRTGLGVTAEGDMLAAMGIKYGTPDATMFCENIHKVLAIESYKSSIEMAKERGCFPIWNINKEIASVDNYKYNPFIFRILSEIQREFNEINNLKSMKDFIISPVQEDYMKYGRRNIANLTLAPTGTVSLMSQTTSGIEPLFMPFYKRRAKTEDKNKIVFVDEVGDGWEEFIVIHDKFKIWHNINFKEDKEIEELTEEELTHYFKLSPYYGTTANDINWVEKVKMQGKIQKWIDHSISVTTNLPSTATEEEVSEIYIQAWKQGCKGQTVYRDGCRSGVLLSSKESVNDKFEYIDAVKRPKELECDIYHKTALKQNWTILVGLLNNKPYEIFVIQEVDNHIFPNKIEKGKIVKVKSKHYQLSGVLGDKTYFIENIVNLMDDTEQRQTRDYSTMLRHCINPSYIIDQIQSYASISSFQKVIERVLRNYIKEQNTKEKCPDCGSVLTYQDGCVKCVNCAWSKCG